jgi:hypothetical protein
MMQAHILVLALLAVVPLSHAQEDEWSKDEWFDEDMGPKWVGFVEGALGSRWSEDPAVGRTQTLGELRWRLETERDLGRFAVSVKGEAWYDSYLEELDGDFRDLSLAFSPGSSWDVKLGRQVLTWGTGDLVFLNDLFPKDWVSFFAGREDEYLKAPSNAVRATWYGESVNVDLAWTPEFEPDEYLTGERFSFFSPLAGRRVAPDPPLSAVDPAKGVENGELAIRIFKTVEATEYALYAYRGFFHQPTALTQTFVPTFAPLTSVGASVRRPLGPGLINVETVFYASRDDRSGDDPRIPNDQLRLLLGYEQEAMTNLTVAFQYYLEWTQNNEALISNSLTPELEPGEYRHLFTNRLTYRLDQDKLTLSLFTSFSPSDSDYYLRPSVSYRRSDQWTFTMGANVFGGKEPHTFFNQLADISNVYGRIRYNY